MASHLPVLRKKTTFNFASDFEAFWEHRIKTGLNENAPTVVVIRDPRDAIFSLHRRWVSNQWTKLSYGEFLTFPSEWPDHFPGLFYLPPIQTFLLFNLLWIRKSIGRPVKMVRFEDLKTHPEKSLQEILEFLNRRITNRSTLSTAAHSSEIMETDKGLAFQANFKGQIFEWKQSHTTEMLIEYSSEPIQAAIAFLGYEANTSRLRPTLEKIVKGHSLFALVLALMSEKMGCQNLIGQFRRLEQAGQFPFKLQILSLIKRLVVSREWALLCGEHNAETKDLNRFFIRLTGFLLKPSELDFVFTQLTRSIKQLSS